MPPTTVCISGPTRRRRSRRRPTGRGPTPTAISFRTAISRTRWRRTIAPAAATSAAPWTIRTSLRSGRPGRLLGTATQIDPSAAQWLGRPSLRLAVQRVGTAADAAARVGRDRLQPALVGELHRHRQPRHRPPGLRPLHVHRAVRSADSRERTAGVLLPEEQPDRVRRGRQLLDARRQLRRHDGVLAGPGIERERPGDQQHHGAGRLHHGGWHSRSLRRHRRGSRAVHRRLVRFS